MAEIKWIKITTDMFDDEKIDFVSSLPEGDSLIVVWVRLLTMAGKNNAGGFIFLTENIPYTEDMLSHKFKKPLNVIKLALKTFRELNMIEFDDKGRLVISNWEKHQNIEALDKIKEQTRLRVAKYRDSKQLGCNVTVTDGVTQCNATDKELDKDKERDISSGQKLKFTDEQMSLAVLLLNRILENKPNYNSPKKLDSWANEIRLMIERDNRTIQQIETVINWCSKDIFWKTIILSAANIRKNFDKLEGKMQQENNQTKLFVKKDTRDIEW